MRYDDPHDELPLLPRIGYSSVVNIGSDFTDEELEFLKIIDRYKRTRNRPYPTWKEVLNVLKSMGYTNTKWNEQGKLIGRV